MENRSYYAGRNKNYNKKSPFVSVNESNFSAKVPRKYLGHRKRYNYKQHKPNIANLTQVKSGCIGANDKVSKLRLFKYQKFVSAYVDPRTPYSCLIWHSVGSGKTMTMWHIIEGYLRRWHVKTDKKQIFMISNPKQLEGFVNEVNTFDKISNIKKHLSKFSRSVKYGDKNRKARLGATLTWKRPLQNVQLILMNFVEASKYARSVGFKNCLVILDEAHNIANPPTTYIRYSKDFKFLANHLSDCVSQRNVKVVPLTATPIKENVSEIGVLLNMVSKRKKFPVVQKDFMDKYEGKLSLLKKDVRGLISYFNREADITVQPRKELRNTQYGNTYIQLGEHQISSIIKNTKKGDKQNVNLLKHLATFSGIRNNNVENHCNKLEDHLMKFGPKILQVLQKIHETNNEKHWVYCGLSRRSGVRPIAESLICKKWTRIKTEKVKDHAGLLKKVLNTLSHGESVTNLPGEDYKRFVVLESTTPQQISSLVLQIVNHYHNVAGKLIRVIIGDSSRKEGMDLYSIKNVHIMSPEEKYSDWHQAISRAIRYCSFKYVPLVKDWVVHIFTYISTTKSLSAPKHHMLNIDEQMIDKATINANKLLPFIHAFKEAAIDCYNNQGIHYLENIKCDMKTPMLRNTPNTKTPSTPKTNSSRKKTLIDWICYFNNLSFQTLQRWKDKCKRNKCSLVQEKALLIVSSRKINPFTGNKNHKNNLNITDFNIKPKSM